MSPQGASCGRIAKLAFGARIHASPRLVGDSVVFGTCGSRIVGLDVSTLDAKVALRLLDAGADAVAGCPHGWRLFISTTKTQLFAIGWRAPSDHL